MSLPVAHTAAHCRWTRREHPAIGAPGWPQPDHVLVCTREPGLRRLVSDPECALCAFWEPVREDVAGAIWISRARRA